MFEKTIALMNRFLEMGIPGNDIVVYQNGSCVLRQYAGYTDIEQTNPMTGQERYNIYSCSKAMTCTAAMQLWERGCFSLNDRLSDYLPEFAVMQVQTEDGLREANNPILICHLFEMTAGFSYDVDSPQIRLVKQQTLGRCSTREVMRYLAREPLLFEPGTQWKYSLCHDVLAALVEVLSGQRFSDYVRTNILEPLGMERTTFAFPESEIPTLADQYHYDVETGEMKNCGKAIQHYQFGTAYESGGAGAVSCVDDYIRFLEALRIGDKILKKETISLMAQDRIMCRLGDSPDLKGRGYGLGYRCPHAGSPAWYSEFGWGGAAGAYYVIDRSRNMTAFYVQHVLTSPMHNLRPLIYQALVEDLDGVSL